jgi:hypothetical protein
MATQKFMGKGQLLDRLTQQVGSRSLAIGILKKRGHITEDGKSYTDLGIKRNMMSASERAKDRASKYSGLAPDEFGYNPKTNKVTKNKR